MAIAPDGGDRGQRWVWPVTDVFMRDTYHGAGNAFCQYNIRNP